MWRSRSALSLTHSHSFEYCTIFRRFALVLLKISIFLLSWNGCGRLHCNPHPPRLVMACPLASLFRVLVDHVYRFQFRLKWRRYFAFIFIFCFSIFLSFFLLVLYLFSPVAFVVCSSFYPFLLCFFLFLSLLQLSKLKIYLYIQSETICATQCCCCSCSCCWCCLWTILLTFQNKNTHFS